MCPQVTILQKKLVKYFILVSDLIAHDLFSCFMICHSLMSRYCCFAISILIHISFLVQIFFIAY